MNGHPHLGPGFANDSLAIVQRLASLEAGAADTRRILQSVDESLKSLVRLEANHDETRKALGRAFNAISGAEDEVHRLDKLAAELSHRLEAVEELAAEVREHLPRLKQSSGWVHKAVLGAAALVGAAAGAVVMERVGAVLAPPAPVLQQVQHPPASPSRQ